MTDENQPSPVHWYKGRTGFTLLVLGGIGGAYFLSEHWEHAWTFLPWLFILVCPLMHLFMHHGHGGHESGAGAGKPKQGE